MTPWIRVMLCLPALLSTAAPAHALELRYSYGEVRAVASSPEGAEEAQGVALAMSTIVSRNLFAVARYGSTESDGTLGVESSAAEAGVGLRFPFTPTVDLVGLAGVAWIDERGGHNDDDFGGMVSAGGRIALSQRFEVATRLRYIEIFSDGDVTLIGDVLCNLTQHLALAGGAEISDDDRGLTLGLRWTL